VGRSIAFDPGYQSRQRWNCTGGFDHSNVLSARNRYSRCLILILLVASVIPLPSLLRARRNWELLLVLVSMEFVLIGMAVAFQVRTSWLNQVKFAERILR
jgi:hypothetical protein